MQIKGDQWQSIDRHLLKCMELQFDPLRAIRRSKEIHGNQSIWGECEAEHLGRGIELDTSIK